MSCEVVMNEMKFNPNKRGLFHVVRSEAYTIDRQTTKERRETVWAVLAIGSILMASIAFLALWWLS